MENREILRMENISKVFPGVKALKSVNFSLEKGEVHALVGENGAGKSTLMKCLIGIQPPTEGKIWYDGKYISNYNTEKALNMGISMIHQELSPIEHRTISDNIWLGREPKNRFGLIDYKKMHEKTREVLKIVDLNESPTQLMRNLTVAKIQMIEIAKAISYDAKIIIMDEPTSALTDKEVCQLYKIIRKLKSEGRSMIYISHKLDEIYEICDRVTVFRDGELIGSRNMSDIQIDEMIRMMVGREVSNLYPKEHCEIGEVLIEVDGLSDGKEFFDVSFKAHRGEILGFAGLVGSGRTQIMETIFGARHKASGKIKIKGKEVEIHNPVDAISNGLALLTEDRRLTGIFPMLSVYYNIVCSHIDSYRKGIFLDYGKMGKDVNEYIKSVNVKTPTAQAQIQNLSGGNQQKVLIARWLLTQPDILILDEPTRGIDVGAKAEIYHLISRLASQGKCVIMISSELPEIIGMSDRVIVMHEGRVSGELKRDELDQEILMTYAAGKKPE
ncbi:MAG: sugar ABC transporter ATP-binding protein [Johnsonella sp.]|nr:sugar ABC transporter ATP-binding protein [Johnsonella sp.]